MRTNMIVSCSFYLVSSAGMSVFNKLAILALPLPITLVMVQMVFTCASIGASWRSVHIGSRRDALRWGLTVPLLFSAMLVSSMVAMEHNTLGTVVVFRNVAPLFTLLIERMFRVPMQVSRGTVGSLLLIVAGVVMYNWNSIALSRVGLAAIVCNMIFAVLERLLQRHLMAQEPVDISKPGMMLLNNSCGLVPNMLLLLVYQACPPRPPESSSPPLPLSLCGTCCCSLAHVLRARRALGAAQEPPRWGEVFGALGRQGWTTIALSCVNGLAISYAGLRVQQLVTATTFMVLTNVNKARTSPPHQPMRSHRTPTRVAPAPPADTSTSVVAGRSW